MKVKNDKLLKERRLPGKCDCCGKWCPDGRDPHHVPTRGSGGSDLRCSVVSLSRYCHGNHHGGGDPTTADLLEIIAKREGVSVDVVKEVTNWFRRLDKDASFERIMEALYALEGDARVLARRELAEAGKLA